MLLLLVCAASCGMQRKKSVGAGGLAVELLLAAGEQVQFAFYDAMMSDLEDGKLASDWKRVLYALIPKPGCHPNVIAEWREIALMPQDLKICLQMVRRHAYLRLEERIAAEQIGWTEGVGAPEVGIILQHTIQQAKRLQHPLWILYIDLATFFPKIRRDLASIAELLTGLPDDVVRLTELVYGAHKDPESAVKCQYDTAAGLGEPFANYIGRLMGCPLSPASAKILLNSILIAICATVKGVRV